MAYEGWALLELMGHRQRVGLVREEELYGGKLLRIDVPVPGSEEVVTEYYGCSSIYALRPISEDVAAEHVRRNGDPRPVRPLDFRVTDQRENGEQVVDDPDDLEF